ncbi:MAG: STAS domain-containing protein [Actinobacteria bacterium]|nr:STAS domain-containing protein [Actinomycetota bacterium]
MSELITVQLLQLPIDVQLRTSAHHDALTREFQVIRAGDPDGTSVPHRLVALMDELTERYFGLGDAQRSVFQKAVDEGRAAIDLAFPVPPEVVPAVVRLVELMDEADEYCRAGANLLTLAAPAEAVRYREWFCQQFVDQMAGAGPLAWPDYVAAHPIDALEALSAAPTPRDTSTGSTSRWKTLGPAERPTLIVEGSLDLDTAPLLRDALQDLRANGAETLVIDLRLVGFVDSVALSVLVAANRRFVEEGAAMTLKVPDRIRRLLEIAELDGVLDISDDG